MRTRMTHARFLSLSEVLVAQERAWPNACNHMEHEYLGTVRSKGKLVDVYVHHGDLGMADVCIRTGPNGPDYMTPGTVLDFLTAVAAESSWYPEVAALIMAKMDFFCERKEHHR